MAKETNKFQRVNWISGMKISKEHFVASENALYQYAQNLGVNTISTINYGLLPVNEGEDAVQIHFSIDGQETINIELVRCKAITLGGHLIDITPETNSYINGSENLIKATGVIDFEEPAYYIILQINPYERVPFGEANPEEEPPRHPYVIPKYKLSIVSESEINNKEFGLHHLTIGKIIVEEGFANLAEDFIPPCTSIQSHQDLVYTFAEIGAFFNAIEKYSMNVIQKIFQKKQTNELAKMVHTICQASLNYLSVSIPEFRIKDKHESPVVMITKLVTLARVIKNSLDVYVGTGKEELINYLSDWSDITQGAFEKILEDIIELEYQHTDINKALNEISQFTKLMITLFKKLNELDYIGKKSDSSIFVKEEIVAKQEVKNRRSFLLD